MKLSELSQRDLLLRFLAKAIKNETNKHQFMNLIITKPAISAKWRLNDRKHKIK